MGQTPGPRDESSGAEGSRKPAEGATGKRPVKTAQPVDDPAPHRAGATPPGQEDALAWLGSEGSTAGPKPGPRPDAPKKSPTWLPWAIGGGVAAVAGLIGIVALILSTGSKPAPQEPPVAKQPAKGKPEVAVRPEKVAPEKPSPPAGENSVLVIDWAEADRGGGTVSIDGRDVPLPASGKVTYQLRPRESGYRIALARPGYEPIQFEHSGRPGEPPAPFEPEWRKVVQTPSKTAPTGPAMPGPKIEEKPVVEPPADEIVLAGWLQDFEKAKRQAAKEKKAVLLAFVGSDWCPPCRRLIQEVFSQPEFAPRIDKDFVRVLVDQPKDPKVRARVDDPARNAALAREFEVRGVPTVVLTDAQGEPFGRLGYTPGGVPVFAAIADRHLRQWRDQLAQAESAPAAKPAEEPLPSPPAKRPDGVKPDEFLKRYGLSKSGDLWVLPAEKAIQQKIVQLGGIRKELSRKQNIAQTAEKQFQAADKTYRDIRLQFDALRRRYDGAIVSTTELAMLNAARARHDETKAAADQARLASEEARAVTNSLGESLATEVAGLIGKYERAQREYTALADSPAIRQAIADLNAGAEKESSLGPADSFRGLTRKLDEWKALVASMSEKVPARQRGKLWYVEVQLNGKKKLEMAIDTGAEILCLPWKAAYEAGLDPDRGQPTLVQVADGSTTRAMRVTVPVVQVGRFTVRNVDCTVLPAEAGEITPLLGQTFLSHFSYRIDAAQRAFLLSGGAGPEKPDSRGKK